MFQKLFRSGKTMSHTFLVVGLGNPGRQYAHTRHNIGFMCVDAFAQKHGLSFQSKKKSKAKIAQGHIGQTRVLLAKPQTYMNRSGSSVQGLAAYYRIPAEHIIVIFDDLDLPLGMLRIRPKGGSGGHRGMKDIIEHLGTQEFPRIRVGIGRPEDTTDPANYVLHPFTKTEESVVEETITRVCNALEAWLTTGIEAAMNRYNGSAPGATRQHNNPNEPSSSVPPGLAQ